MYSEDYEGTFSRERSSDEIYSKPVKAGKRTYFFDVKTTKGKNDFYLTITESKSGDLNSRPPAYETSALTS